MEMSSIHSIGSDGLSNGLYNCNNIVLRSALSELPSRLNICYMNVGSIFPKIDLIRNVLAKTNLHIVVVSESCLKSYHSNK